MEGSEQASVVLSIYFTSCIDMWFCISFVLCVSASDGIMAMTLRLLRIALGLA
jgi:hypothetical protein